MAVRKKILKNLKKCIITGRTFCRRIVPGSFSIFLVSVIILSSIRSNYSQPDRVINRGAMVVPGDCKLEDILHNMFTQFRATSNEEFPKATVRNCFAPNSPDITFFLRTRWLCHGTDYENTRKSLYQMLLTHLANAPSIKSMIIENKLSGKCDGGRDVLQIEGMGTTNNFPGVNLWSQMKENLVIRKFIKNLNQGGNTPGPWKSYGGSKNVCSDSNEDGIMFSAENPCFKQWHAKTSCSTPEKFFSRECPDGGDNKNNIFNSQSIWGSWAHQYQINLGDSNISPTDYGDPIFPQKSVEILIKPVMRAPGSSGESTVEFLDAKDITVNDIIVTGGEKFTKAVIAVHQENSFKIRISTNIDRDDPKMLKELEEEMLETKFFVSLGGANPDRVRFYHFRPENKIFYEKENDKIDPPGSASLPQLLEVGWAPPSNSKTIILSLVDEDGKPYTELDLRSEDGKIFPLVDPNKTQEEKRQCLNIQSFDLSRVFFERIGTNQIALHFRNHNVTDRGKPANNNETDFSDIMNPKRFFKDVDTAGMIKKVDDWKTDFKACNRFSILNKKFKLGGSNPNFSFESVEPLSFGSNRLVVRKPTPMISRKLYFQPGTLVKEIWQAQTLNLLKEVLLAGGVPGMEVQFTDAGNDAGGKKIYLAEILAPKASEASFAQANLQLQLFPGHASKSSEYRVTPAQSDAQVILRDSEGRDISPEVFTTSANASAKYFKLAAPSGTANTTHVTFYLVDQNGKELTASELQGFPLISNVDQAIKRKCLQPGNSVTAPWTASEINFENESGNKVVAWFSQKNKSSVIRSLNSYKINRTEGYPVMYGTGENFGMAASCGGFSIKPGANIFIKPFGNSTKYGIVFESTGSNNLTVIKPVDFSKTPVSLKISFKDVSIEPQKLNPDGLKIILENSDLKYKSEQAISGNNDLIFSGITMTKVPNTDFSVKKYSLRGYKIKIVTSFFGNSGNFEDYRFLANGKKSVEMNLSDIVPDTSSIISDFTAKFTDASETDRVKMYLMPPVLNVVPKKSKLVAFAIEKAQTQTTGQAAESIDISKDCLKFFSDAEATKSINITYEKLSENNYLMKLPLDFGTESSDSSKFYIKTPKAESCKGYQAQRLIWENEKPISKLQDFQAKYASETIVAQVDFSDENSPISFNAVGSTSDAQTGVLRLYKNELLKFRFIMKSKFSDEPECAGENCKSLYEGMSLVVQDEKGKLADFAISEMTSPEDVMLLYLDSLSGYAGKYKLSITGEGGNTADFLYYFDSKFAESKQNGEKIIVGLSGEFAPDEVSDYKLPDSAPQKIEVSRLNKRARESLDIRVMGKVDRSDTYKLIGNNNVTINLKNGKSGVFKPNTYFERISGDSNLEKYKNHWAKARYTYEIKVNNVVKSESKEGYAWIKENGTPCIGKKDFNSFKVVACGSMSLRDKPNGNYLKNSLGTVISLKEKKEDHSIYVLEDVVPTKFVMKPVINQHENTVTTDMIVETDDPQKYITAAPYKVEWPYEHDVKDGKYMLCMVESESKTGCGFANVSITGIGSGGSEFIEVKSPVKSEFIIKMQAYIEKLKKTEGKTEFANGKTFYMAMDLPNFSRDANIRIEKDEESGVWQLAGGGNVIYVTEDGVEVPGNGGGGTGFIASIESVQLMKNSLRQGIGDDGNASNPFLIKANQILNTNEKIQSIVNARKVAKSNKLFSISDSKCYSDQEKISGCWDHWAYGDSSEDGTYPKAAFHASYRNSQGRMFANNLAAAWGRHGCALISQYMNRVTEGRYKLSEEEFARFVAEVIVIPDTGQIYSWFGNDNLGGRKGIFENSDCKSVNTSSGPNCNVKSYVMADQKLSDAQISQIVAGLKEATSVMLHMGNGNVQASETHFMPLLKHPKGGWIIIDFNDSVNPKATKWDAFAELYAKEAGKNIERVDGGVYIKYDGEAFRYLWEVHKANAAIITSSTGYSKAPFMGITFSK